MAVRQRKKPKKQSGRSTAAEERNGSNGTTLDNGGTASTSKKNDDDGTKNGISKYAKLAAIGVVLIGGLVVLSFYLLSDTFGSSSASSSSSLSSSSSRETTTSPTTQTQSVAPEDTANPTTSLPPREPISAPIPEPEPLVTKRGSFRILDRWPHDPTAYCQGLEVKNATHLYESIGLYEESALRIVETVTGDVTWENTMPDEMFGEGVSLIDPDGTSPYLLQLTWHEKTAFVYHPETLHEISRMPYETTSGQGWGVAYDTHQKNIVYVSDGTEFIHTWRLSMDDETGEVSYEQIARTAVTFDLGQGQGPRAVTLVNELEYDPHTKTILANIYFQNVLVRIDPATGFTTHIYDFSSIYTNRDPNADVFNGVALIPGQPGRFYVTGKLWPTLYYVKLVEPK